MMFPGNRETRGTVDSQEKHDLKPLPERFPPGVSEGLGTYVYALRDPRTSKIFYVGKGNGERVFQHVWGTRAQAGKTENPELADIVREDGDAVTAAKECVINEIYDSGRAVEHLILRHAIEAGANSDREAFIIEQVLIRAFREHDGGSALTNRVEGHSSAEYATFPIAELIARYSARPLEGSLPQPCGIVVINRAWHSLINDPEVKESGGAPKQESIYEAARRWWKVGSATRERAEIPILVVAGNVIRAAYRVESWRKKPYSRGHKTLWEFSGEPAEDLSNLIGCALRPEDAGYSSWRQHGWHPGREAVAVNEE